MSIIQADELILELSSTVNITPGVQRIYYLQAKCVVTQTGCLEYTGYCSPDGYCRSLVAGKRGTLHRAVYTHLIGPIPAGMIVRHSCDNRRCLNEAHLILGTHHDNNNDALERKRAIPGKWLSISAETKIRVLDLVKQGYSQYKIASIIGIAQTTVSQISIQAGVRRR